MTTIYAGLRATKDGGIGGLFRLEPENGRWERALAADVQAITPDPRRPGVVFAGAADGPYRSRDDGKIWTRLRFPDASVQLWSLALDPAQDGIVYAGGSPVSVYRSDDAGESFRRMPDPGVQGRVRMSFDCRVMRIAPNPTRAGELYAALEVGGAIRSRDGGESWEDCASDLVRLGKLPHLRSRIVSDTEDEGMLDGHAVAMTAAAPDRAFLAVRMGLFRSDDAGRTWQDMEIWRVSTHGYARDLRVSPHNPKVLYACLSPAFTSDAGSLWRSEDAGETWSRFDATTPGNTAMAVALHPSDPNQVFFAAKTRQVFGTRDGGASWREFPIPEGTGEVYALGCG